MQTGGPNRESKMEYNRGKKHFESGDIEKALGCFERAVAKSPGWSDPYLYRGLSQCHMGNFDRGILDFHKVIDIFPRSVDARYFLGVAYEHKESLLEASHYYLQAVQLDPDCRSARERLQLLWGSEPATKPTIIVSDHGRKKSQASKRKFIEISFEENDREQSKPVMKECQAVDEDLSTIALEPEARKYIDRVRKTMQNPELARKCKLRKSAGVVLGGPNGTGKTRLAHSLAGEMGWNMVSVPYGNISSKWLGQTEGNISRLFTLLRDQGYLPAVVLFDEIDGMVRSKDGESRSHECSIVNAFINEINRLTDENGIEGIFVVGTTNHMGLIDPSIIRSGRLDSIKMPLPSPETRAEIFRIHLNGKPLAKDIDYLALAAMTGGCSGADIAEFANEASYRLFEDRLEGRRRRKINMAMLEEIIGPEPEQERPQEKPGGYA